MVVYCDVNQKTDELKRIRAGLLAHRSVALVALFSFPVRQKLSIDNRKLPVT